MNNVLKMQIVQARKKIKTFLVRSILNAISDESNVQLLKVISTNGVVLPNVEHIQNYGLTTVAPTGGETLLATINADTDQVVALAVNKNSTRPKGYESNDVVLYSDHGHKIELISAGIIITDKYNNTIKSTSTSMLINDNLEVLR